MLNNWCSHMPKAFERFWKYANKPKQFNYNCWNWLGALSSGKYGAFWDGKRQVKAHRFVYEMVYGKIPEGRIVMHICDNMKCVNPSHLKLGTMALNILDREKKGRGAKGQKHGAYKHGKRVGEVRKNYVYKVL